MDLEVRQVAAMVSLNQQCKNKNDHLQLQAISETEFRLISNNFSGLSSPETLFSTPPLNSQNCFWKIARSAGCDQIVFAFAHCLQSLVLRNFVLLHNSQKVINIFVVNSTGMNVSNSKMFHEPHILVPKDISHLDVDINIPLYSSYSNMERMRNEVQFGRACREINRGIPEQQSTEQRTADHKKFIPHWWVCVVTANHKMFHIDLCGPAYEIFDYESNVFNLTTKRFDEAPVHIFETEKYMLVSLSKHGFDHKFSMLQSIFPGLIRCFPSNLHFSGIESGCQVSLTPLGTFLNRKNSSLIPTEASGLSNKIGNYFLLNAPNDIAVLTHNLLTSNLNNKIGRITHQGISFSESADARIGVLLEGDIDSVRIRPKNLVLYPSLCHKQFLSLKEVKHEVNELDNCAFIRLAKVTITGLTSEEGARINGQEGTIVNGPLKPLEPHQRVQDYRYSVELNLNKVRKSISVKNLVLAKNITIHYLIYMYHIAKYTMHISSNDILIF
jgi:hypothetical protein